MASSVFADIITQLTARITPIAEKIRELQSEEAKLIKAREGLEALTDTEPDETPGQQVAVTSVSPPKREATTQPELNAKGKPRRRNRAAGPPIKESEIRDYIVETKQFTIEQLSRHFTRTNQWGYNAIKTFLTKGIVKKSGKNPVIYTYIPPKADGIILGQTPSRSSRPPKRFSGTAGVEGAQIAQRQGKTNNKEMDQLLSKARQQGFKTDGTGKDHIAVYHPNQPNRKVYVSKTPGHTHGGLSLTKSSLKSIGVKL